MSAAPILSTIGSLADHAAEYARAGFEVFPLNPQTKAPFDEARSQKHATTDDRIVAAWWRQTPHALIGHRIPVGILLTDIDPRHGGIDTWQALQADHGPRPATRIHRSGRGDGGGHIWWRCELADGETFNVRALDAYAREHGTGHKLESGRWSCGIDLLQHGHRYTILPPSPHPDTGAPYQWDTTGATAAIAEIPAWLRDLVVVARREPVASAPSLTASDDSIIDWFNSRYSIAMLLGRAGWTCPRGDGDHDGSYWRHPQATAAHSASISEGLLYVHSPNTAFEPTAPGDPHGYDAFDIWTTLEHRGDRSVAARAARTLKDGAPAPRIQVGDLIAKPQVDDIAADLDRCLAPVLPDELWLARPVLEQVRQAAWSRIRSPDVVLHGLLARLSAYTPHTFELPPIAGSAGSLNYFAAAIGPSGSGKSSGVSIAAELLERPAQLDVADNRPLGSGEGLAENYMGTVEDVDEKGKKIKVRRQVRHNAFVYADEGAALSAMMERRGATLPEALRRAWTGADLGQANASADTTRVIAAGQYRLGLLIGFQPELAGQLLADANAGTPQRFMWAWATDPNIPDERPPWPGPIDVPRLAPAVLNAHETRGGSSFTRHRLGVHDDITAELQAQALQRARGEVAVAPLDSHEPLHRLKLAGLLAILDGRLDINLEDWRLADILWATSCRVRASVVASVAAETERNESAGIERNARRELAAQAARNSAGARTERLAARLARWVHDAPERPEDGWPRYQVTGRLKGSERHLFEAAAAHAIALQWIEETAERFLPGSARPA